jgi:N-acyl-D-aspartate/D-glutamate deacylase
MLDLLLENGTVVDGSGGARYRADVGVRDGRITVVGASDEPARRTIDAAGLVVCPGFIDVHTHYDAQVMWDPYATPSCLHGVTTVIGGNCGFSIAPLHADSADYVCRMLAVVEGMPLEALRAGLAWDWRDFGDWLRRLDGHLGVNAGFLVGHSALRRLVLGDDAVGGEADAAQTDEMVRQLHDALAAGGIGFSSSWSPTHVDGDARPVPSRSATLEELLALATAAGQHPGTTLAFIPGVPPFSAPQVDAMIAMSKAANRPLNWNTFRITSPAAATPEDRLAPSVMASEQGARVIALAFPSVATFLFSFEHAAPLTGIPGWSAVMERAVPERMVALGDPATREALRRGASSATGQLASLAAWPELRIAEGFSPGSRAVVGETVGRVAERRGEDAFDTILELAIGDELRTLFATRPAGDDAETWRLRSYYWGDERTLIGGSDAGAHLDALCGATYTTDFLGGSVRDRELISLERAVQLLTDAPARLLGLRDRGRVAEGAWADLVVFDPERIAPGPLHVRTDLPAGAARLYSDAVGIEHVLVNGVPIVRSGEVTGDLPGTALRSADHLYTVPVR